MRETFIVTIGEGEEAYGIYYDDYGNAAECAQAYREMGFKVTIKKDL